MLKTAKSIVRLDVFISFWVLQQYLLEFSSEKVLKGLPQICIHAHEDEMAKEIRIMTMKLLPSQTSHYCTL
jgi:hypothetical protein